MIGCSKSNAAAIHNKWFSHMATDSMLVRECRAKLAAGTAFAQGDFAFTPRASVHFLFQCLFTGAMAGVFGIGGGVFIGL
jgi:hypothetical protein